MKNYSHFSRRKIKVSVFDFTLSRLIVSLARDRDGEGWWNIEGEREPEMRVKAFEQMSFCAQQQLHDDSNGTGCTNEREKFLTRVMKWIVFSFLFSFLIWFGVVWLFLLFYICSCFYILHFSSSSSHSNQTATTTVAAPNNGDTISIFLCSPPPTRKKRNKFTQ